MIYLRLFYEFFKIGLFAMGGGLATIPFLYDLAGKYDWFTIQDIADMIAISESTPGPVGVNMATFAGFQGGGIGGGIIATLGLVAPSIIVIIIVAKVLVKFKNNPYIAAVFVGLRPAVLGLIAVAGFSIFSLAVLQTGVYDVSHQFLDLFNLKACLLLVVLGAVSVKYYKHPLLYLLAGAILGICFKI